MQHEGGHLAQKTHFQNLGLAVVLVMLTLDFRRAGTLAFVRPSALGLDGQPGGSSGIVASAGLTLVLILGGIDLSVGSVLALASVLVGLGMVQLGVALRLWPAGLGILAGSFCLCGFANGWVTAKRSRAVVHRDASACSRSPEAWPTW